MTFAHQAVVAGVAQLENGSHSIPERDMATSVIRQALSDADRELTDVDGLYLPKPRPWTSQGFFSTMLTNQLGLEQTGGLEIYTGGTSGAHAFHSAIRDVSMGRCETAIVLAVERNSIVETDRYLEYILTIFDREFQSPAGPTIPGVYAMSLQRYLYEYDIPRDEIADIIVKNRENASRNPNALFSSPVTRSDVLESRLIANPLRLFECPAPCDGAAALVVTTANASDGQTSVPVIGTGYHHAATHLIGPRNTSLATFPAVRAAGLAALDMAGLSITEIDILEPYAPFPHIEAILTEELGLFDRGDGVQACLRGETATDGRIPVSPSGGCIGRGHPAMVTPLLNYIAAVEQIRGTAPYTASTPDTVLTTAEHGHLDGVTATIFGGDVYA